MNSLRPNGTALQSAQPCRFGDFEYNPERRELCKHGVRVRLQPQPLAILLALLESAHTVVSREELRARLWGGDTFVEFEQGLNSAIKRLRDALCDSVDNPRFIETVPGEGYRFVAPVESFLLPTSMPPEATPAVVSSVSRLELAPARRALWPLSTGIGIAGALVLAFVVWRPWSPTPERSLNFQARDWVLITNFENRTGEPVFDGALEYAVERELSNSQFVNVVPRERVNDALRLMRRPLDSKIDAALGREICLRDGGIRVLLTGRAEKLGTTYVLSAELVDPIRGVTVASISEEDPAESRLASTLHRLSNRVRETLGEKREFIQQGNAQLEKVTTPSLHALQLYTQANELMRQGRDNDPAAEELLKQAVAEDPDFASGHLLLAYVYLDTGSDAEAQPEFQRAVDLADSASERERLFILASYNGKKGDDSKATQAYEALLRLYPDHYWATNNLDGLYEAHDRFDDSRKLILHFADLNPESLTDNVNAVLAKGILEQDWNGAQRYLDRAKALLAQEGDAADQGDATWIKLLPVYQDWLQGRVQSAYDELVRIDQASADLDPVLVGESYGMFGCLREESRHYYRVSPPKKWADDALGLIEFERGNWGEVKKHLQRYRAGVGSSDSMLMSRIGMWSEVERSLKNASPTSSYKMTAGELALDEGHTATGIVFLEAGVNARALQPTNQFFLGSESLSLAYEKQGKFDDALRILQQASAEKPRIFGLAWEALWMRAELHLADLYRTMGRVSEAEKVENELSKLLVVADPDYPILVELRNRSGLRAPSAAGN